MQMFYGICRAFILATAVLPLTFCTVIAGTKTGTQIIVCADNIASVIIETTGLDDENKNISAPVEWSLTFLDADFLAFHGRQPSDFKLFASRVTKNMIFLNLYAGKSNVIISIDDHSESDKEHVEISNTAYRIDWDKPLHKIQTACTAMSRRDVATILKNRAKRSEP